MSCRTELRRIDRFLLRELSPSDWGKLKAHLDGCPACAQQYDRAVLVLRQLAGGAGVVAEEEWALIGPVVARRASLRWRPWTQAPAALLLAGAVALTVFFAVPEAGEVQPRGGSRHGGLSLRAYCVSEAQPDALRVIAASDASGLLRCARGELVQFAYQLAEGQPRWLHLAGVDADGQVLRYYPRPAQATSQPLEARALEQVLPGSIRLAARHQPGVVQVVGLITTSPLSPEDGDARVAKAAQGGPDGVVDAEVVRLSLEVLP
ncbi:MAG: zf-HC2 domain-containing protein [Archangium sp.]|nr:zf-HC2 domain-containing protein [Archangium sp.]